MASPGDADWDPLAEEHERVATEESREATFLTVRVLDETYALPVERVAEILRSAQPTHLPSMPSFIEGVVERRGQVVPVLDLRARFGARPAGGPAGPVVVVTVGERALGLMVDGLAGLRKVPAGSVRPLPDGLPVAGRGFVTGVVPGGDGKLTVVLDPDRLLRGDEEATLARAAEAAARLGAG